jgi:hypothetical protein
MLRTASLLIVMAIAGGPTAKVVCDLSCLAESTRTDHPACHEAAHQTDGPVLAAAQEICSRVADLGPFMARNAYSGSPPAAQAVVPAGFSAATHDARRMVGFSIRVDTGPPPARRITVLRI